MKKKTRTIKLINEYACYNKQNLDIQQEFNWYSFFFLGFYYLYKRYIMPLAFLFAFADVSFFYSFLNYLNHETASQSKIMEFCTILVVFLLIRFFVAMVGGIQITKYYMLKGYRIYK